MKLVKQIHEHNKDRMNNLLVQNNISWSRDELCICKTPEEFAFKMKRLVRPLNFDHITILDTRNLRSIEEMMSNWLKSQDLVVEQDYKIIFFHHAFRGPLQKILENSPYIMLFKEADIQKLFNLFFNQYIVVEA